MVSVHVLNYFEIAKLPLVGALTGFPAVFLTMKWSNWWVLPFKKLGQFDGLQPSDMLAFAVHQDEDRMDLFGGDEDDEEEPELEEEEAPKDENNKKKGTAGRNVMWWLIEQTTFAI